MKNLLASVVLLLSTSCASIITGPTDDILVTSNPPGARFRTNLGAQGFTPQTISVSCKKALSVQFAKEGYEEASAHVGTRLSGWLVGNVVFGGLIGLVVDVAGNGYVHSEDHVHADLSPLASGREKVTQERPDGASHRTATFDEWAARTGAGTP